jgi:uncharacterized protein YukE
MGMAPSQDEVFNGMPSDIAGHAHDLFNNAVTAEGFLSSAISNGILETLNTIRRLKGNPQALHDGESIIRSEVKTHVTEAKSALKAGLDGFNSGGAWEGSSANAFFDYTPRLLSAIGTMEQRCEGIANSIAAIRDGIAAMWKDVIDATLKAAEGSAAALNGKNAGDVVAGIATAWTGGIRGLISAFFALYDVRFQAMDTLNSAAANTTDLTNVAARSYKEYDGPAGYQLPMPTEVSLSPDWTTNDLKSHWRLKTGDQFQVQLEPLHALEQTVRANGDFWTSADRALTRAWFAMPPDAFSIAAKDYYTRLCDVLATDSITYSFADGRMDQLGNLLGQVGTAYGDSDAHATRLTRDYLRNL